MEALAGARQRQQPEDFPNSISPFPESTDRLVFANPTAGAHSSPQKLRPIRPAIGSARSPAVELPEKAENLGDGCPVQVGSDSGTWEDEVEDESSSSPDDECDGEDEQVEAQGAEPVNRKRKRRSSGGEIDFERVERFLESLVMKVMEKQERMHKQMMEMVEKRERDRLAREEAWKQEELDKEERDKEIRAQETSRSLALISFIQKFVGHEIQVPQPSPSPSPVTPGPVTAPIQSPLPLAVAPSNNDQRCTQQNGGADNGIQRNMMLVKDEDSENRRWPEAEVKALIALRGAAEHKFRYAGTAGSKISIWEEISIGMHDMGYNRSAKKCKEKWENMNKYFKKSMVSDKKRPANSKTRPYFLELEMLHRNGVVSSGNGFKWTNNQNETKTEKE